MMGLTNTAGAREVLGAVAWTRRLCENARQSQAASWRAASVFPLVNYLLVAPPCTSLSANLSIMLRSYTRGRPRWRVTKQEMAAVSGVGIGSGPRV
jgi:hypothetical protein